MSNLAVALGNSQEFRTFSQKNGALIRLAYPHARLSEIQKLRRFYDRFVSSNEFIRERVESHLQGRAFGFWGKRKIA